MKKRAPFQMRSGNKPSPTKLMGVLTGKKKFKDSRLGQQLKRDAQDIKSSKLGQFLGGLGKKKAKAGTVNNTEGVLKGDKGNFAANKGIVKNFASSKPKAKTDFTKVKGSTTYKAPSFNTAFGDARKAGKKVFDYKGKSYTTELAKPKKKKSKSGNIQVPKSASDYAKKYGLQG